MPKKIIFSEFGKPSVLRYVEYELGKTIKKDHVRVKNLSIGINYIDTYHRRGIYPVNLPSDLGLEGVSEVVDVGPGVKKLKIGDRVGYSSLPLGAYSEIRDYPENGLFKIPLFLKDDEAASILLQGMTGILFCMYSSGVTISFTFCLYYLCLPDFN